MTALKQSEESHIERTMLDDKLAATDWEATQDELIQQIARESYLQWLCDTNQQNKDNKTVTFVVSHLEFIERIFILLDFFRNNFRPNVK